MTALLPKISGRPEEILDHLLQRSELSGIELALYDSRGQVLAIRGGSSAALCGAAGNLLCNDDCPQRRQRETALGTNHDNPYLATCPGGLWHYLQPVRMEGGSVGILGAGGVRGHDINLSYLEELALKKGLSASLLLEYLDSLPALSRQEMLETGRVLRQSLTDAAVANQAAVSPSAAPITDLTAGLIKAVAETETGLAEADSPAAILDAVNEALAPHFTPRQIALFLPGSEGEPADWVFPERTAGEPFETDGMDTPAAAADAQITCLPLQAHKELAGCLILHTPPPSSSDLLLLKILAARIAGRLDQLKSCHQSEGPRPFPAEYLLNKLETLGTKRDLRSLCRQVLETAAQLAKAEKGSLMLLDGNKLWLQCSIGMSRDLAEGLIVPADQGIAGMVLESGRPLLVPDLAKDSRIRFMPRPRFRTSSLLSLPLHAHQGLLGVLNLADKWDDSPFTEADSTLLTTWAGYCAPFIERLASNQALQQMKQQTSFDPLTGAYSQTLLEKRFAEEASRSSRGGQELVLMLVASDRQPAAEPDPQARQADEKAIGGELANLLRKMDVISRLASGSFAVLLPDTSREGARIVAERLRRTVAERHGDRQLTISCGLALFPRHGATFAALLRSAEAALQQARKAGGNAAVFVDQIQKSDKIIYI